MSATPAALELHPDRLFPAEPGVRAVARRLHASVADLPVVSPHGHVPAGWLADDMPFADPTSLLVTPDHYVTRLLHAHGVELSALGVGQGPLTEQQSREAFRTVCAHWDVFRGTPVRFWLEAQLADLFGVDRPAGRRDRRRRLRPGRRLPGPAGVPAARPLRALRHRPAGHHRRPVRRPRRPPPARPRTRRGPAGWCRPSAPTATWRRRSPTWGADLDRLAAVSGVDTGDYAGFVAALEDRRRYFRQHGAVSTDHSHPDARTDVLETAEAGRLFTRGRAGEITVAEATALRRHLVSEMARMSRGGRPGHDAAPGRPPQPPPRRRPSSSAPTSGTDIPVRAWSFTDALRPLLDPLRHRPRTSTSCCSPSTRPCSRARSRRWPASTPRVYAGAPWWFLDAPEAIRRYRGGGHRVGGVRQDVGFHRRHPGVLLDPRPARHVPSARRRLPGHPGRRAPADRGRGAGDGRTTSSSANPREGVQAVSTTGTTGTGTTGSGPGTGSPPRLSRSCPAPRRPRRSGSCTSGSATSTAPTRPGTPPRAPDADAWGIAAFTGRRPDVAAALAPQDGLYTLITRHADRRRLRGDRARSPRCTPPTSTTAYLDHLARPEVAVVTITVTEAGYLRGAGRPAGGRPRRRRRRRRRAAGRPRVPRSPRCPPGWSPGCSPAAAPTPVRSPCCPATTCPTTAR